MKKRSYSFILASVALLAMLLVSGFNYYVDPFTYYHPPWTEINFSKNHRFSNPGLARQFEYDAVLVGTSHVMELESSRFSEITGMQGLNLATNGGSIREQAELVELVLRQGKAREIYWEMNFPSFSLGDVVGTLGEQHPEYFYDPSIETPFRYLVNFDTLKNSWKALQDPGSINIDNRNAMVAREFSERRVIDHWNHEMEVWTPEVMRYWADIQGSVEPAKVILERRLKPLLGGNPGVYFKLFLPPHHLLFFLLHDAMGAGDFEKWLEFRAALAELVDEFPNAELHDFQADPALTADYQRYRDLEHFHPEVLIEMIEQVTSGQGMVNGEQVRANSALLRERVMQYGREFCAQQTDRCPPFLVERLQ